MDIVLLTGVTASVFTAASMLPQLVKLIREKKSKDISFGMLGILVVGLSCWIVYGVMRDDWIIIASNAFSWLVTITTIAVAIRYR